MLYSDLCVMVLGSLLDDVSDAVSRATAESGHGWDG
jgi:hypothetical protein